MANISDFMLAKKVLQVICNDFDFDFVDCRVVFERKDDRWDFVDGVLQGPAKDASNQTLGKTLYMLIETYLRFLPQINGHFLSKDEYGPVLAYVFALTNAFTMKEGHNIDGDKSDYIALRLNQNPLVWILMKNIICPLKQVQLQNFRIIAGHSHIVDAAAYITEKEMPNSSLDSDEFPFIFLNLDLESESIRAAFLLYYAIEAHFPEEDASNIIRSLFTDYFLKKDLVEFIKMALVNEEDIVNFFATLSLITQMEEIELMAVASSKNLVKISQNVLQGSFWFQGLIEKMLGSMRGPDWSVTKGWKSITDELWQKVETERKRRGLDEVPFDLLLRISSDHLKVNDKKTIQGLLNTSRIW